jgi:excisionase family DNA binding protein
MGTKNYTTLGKNEEFISTRRMAYSINEAAVLLGVSPNHLRNENTRGHLKFVRSGLRRILITDTELRRYLEGQVVE